VSRCAWSWGSSPWPGSAKPRPWLRSLCRRLPEALLYNGATDRSTPIAVTDVWEKRRAADAGSGHPFCGCRRLPAEALSLQQSFPIPALRSRHQNGGRVYKRFFGVCKAPNSGPELVARCSWVRLILCPSMGDDSAKVIMETRVEPWQIFLLRDVLDCKTGPQCPWPLQLTQCERGCQCVLIWRRYRCSASLISSIPSVGCCLNSIYDKEDLENPPMIFP